MKNYFKQGITDSRIVYVLSCFPLFSANTRGLSFFSQQTQMWDLFLTAFGVPRSQPPITGMYFPTSDSSVLKLNRPGFLLRNTCNRQCGVTHTDSESHEVDNLMIPTF
ncbi:hypothetical protein ATANTOWER_030789 [Ataeniobius toweri]|uniref:Uncharacterized protein n=1 Tax=Ataeniobius toweri TaxID=208326 RepID=A0ABU7C4B0_9TELE|nr:hypothetical protein [Ataeniobius toweri]